MRPTTKRRLLTLFVIVLAITGAGGGFLAFRLSRLEGVNKQRRANGMAAFAAGEYDQSLTLLSKYVSDNKEDSEALFALAVARSQVTMPNGQHLKTAIGYLNNYLDMKKGDSAGQHKLLDLYARVRWNPEIMALSDDILQVSPNDLPALRAKTGALKAQQKFDQALIVSEKINDLAPLDIDAQRTTFQLLAQLKRPAKDLLARAKAGLDAHPQDPRFELLQASAFDYAGDQPNADKFLMLAIGRKATDPDFVRLATKMLDGKGMFDQSQKLLEHAVTDLNDPAVLQMLVERLWQSGQIDEMAKRLEAIKPDDAKADSNLLAMKAISLLEHNQTAEALIAVKTLASRAADDEAFAWSTSIPARYAVPAPDPRKSVAALMNAANRDRDNAVVRLWLGEAYEKLNETELELGAYRAAGDIAPAWAEPHVRSAKALALTGRGQEAYDEAAIASNRNPNSLQTRIAMAMSVSALTNDSPAAVNGAALLKTVTGVQTDSPNEPQTLPMYVTLLAQSGDRAKAIAAIASATKANPPLATEALLRLAAVSNELQLDQQQAIFDAMVQAGNKSPELALARAKALLTQGKGDEGKKLLADTSAGQAGRAEWAIATAQYLEAAGDAGAAKAWNSAVEAFTTDLRVQSAFLKSATRSGDRAVWSATIDRVKTLTLEEGITWRLERARFLLNGQPSERERADAVTMLNDIIRSHPGLAEPRLMLASALLKTNNIAAAIEQLKFAAQLRPSDPQIAMSLAGLLIDSGKAIEGQAYLERLANSNQLSATGKRVVAQTLAEQGQTDRAIQLLQSIPGEDASRDALIAQLFRRSGKGTQAAALYAKIAKASPLMTDAIAATADYYFAIGDAAAAKSVLGRLKDASDAPAPGTAELIHARLAEQYQSTEEAAWWYEAAVKASPDARTTKSLAAFQLRRRQYAAAKATLAPMLAPMLAANKDDADLVAISKLADDAAAVPANVDVSMEVSILSRNPQNAAAKELFTAAVDSAAAKENAAQRAVRYKAIADRNPKFWPAAQRLINAYTESGQYDRARETCLLAATALPADPAPLQSLWRVYATQSDWNAALTVVNQWRARSMDNQKPCDTAAAEAMVGLGQSRQALAVLAPYVDAAKKNVTGSLDVIWPLGRALLQDGRAAEATALMEEAIKHNAGVRSLWLAMASDVSPDNAAAVAWIKKVSPLLNANSASDQAALARAWFAVASRYKDPAAYAESNRLLRAVAEKNDSEPSDWALLGESLRGSGDLNGAESAYREALLRGDATYSPNAMAFLLLTQDKSLDEALALATKAIAASPRTAAYFDTRGQINLRLKKFDDAIKDFDQALILQPEAIDSMVGKADALSQAGKKDKAAELLRYIDSVMARQPELSSFAKKQLAGLKAASLN